MNGVFGGLTGYVEGVVIRNDVDDVEEGDADGDRD